MTAITKPIPRKTVIWYSIVGIDQRPKPAKGPHRSLAEALAAIVRFRNLSVPGHYLNCIPPGTLRIVGPFPTRKLAHQADFNSKPLEREIK